MTAAHLNLSVHGAGDGNLIGFVNAKVFDSGGEPVGSITIDATATVSLYSTPAGLVASLRDALAQAEAAAADYQRREILAAYSAHRWVCFTRNGELVCRNGCDAISDRLEAAAAEDDDEVEDVTV